MGNLRGVIILCLCIIGLTECEQNKTDLITQLSEEKTSLKCEIDRLKVKSDSLWNEMEIYLDENLPTDIPPVERKNMISIRVDHLIARFNSFNSLDSTIKNRVYEAGKEDEKIALEMKSTKEKFHETEDLLNQELEKLNSEDQEKYNEVKLKLKELNKLPCDY